MRPAKPHSATPARSALRRTIMLADVRGRLDLVRAEVAERQALAEQIAALEAEAATLAAAQFRARERVEGAVARGAELLPLAA